MRVKFHGCSIIFRDGEIVVQPLQFALPSTGQGLVLEVSAPEEIIRMNICSSGKSVQSGDDVVRNEYGQGRSALLGCETETVSLNARSGAHERIACPQVHRINSMIARISAPN